MVDTRIVVITIDISYRRKFAKVFVALFVFSQYNKVITSVGATVTLVDAHRSAVSLHTEYRFKHLFLKNINLYGSVIFLRIGRFFVIQNLLLIFYLIFNLTVIFISGIGKFLDTEHISVIGESHGIHTAASTFVDEVRHFRHSVEYRKMRVNMKMREMIWSV